MKNPMTKKEAEFFADALVTAIKLKVDPSGKHNHRKWTYALSMNKGRSKDEMISIGKDKDGLKDYWKAIDEVYKKYSKKEKDGSPERKGKGYVMDPNSEDRINQEIKKIEEIHKKVLDEVKSIHDENSEFNPYMVDFEYVPNGLGAVQDVLLPMFREPKEETV